ncbi:tRNA pseudouridine(55) synthase TruB [Catenisphaera adipataccumulans]|uniref:tRNA pseudouridine synthase B n=1 Tax=Catenisphaera adipataccumulans TaxID=700500 RepID=A0A7W8CXZ6_9FIRM|nr:tRNA pseudouridine(55) synthase TruB [Catenisphaera adipataccumulans]MBB5183688.1 tRNA pseudouridine55 synthase [Catenisphaera adipataccumulans]
MDGILIIDKPQGMTSHDVINALRRKYGQKKFGHTGTLDPEATGVLVVLCGKATKALQFLTDTDKTYIAQFELGKRTDTDDIWGNVIETKPVRTDFDLNEVLQSFVGPLHQKVPMTSNKRYKGRKLLEYQRKGITVPDVYQDVTVYSVQALNDDTFRIHCSSGTYVRSICRDLGEKTGNAACMKSLRRVQVGRFTIDQAQTIEEEPKLYSMAQVLDHLPKIEPEDCQPVYQGKRLYLDREEPLVCIYENGEPIAVYEKEAPGQYHSKRGLW